MGRYRKWALAMALVAAAAFGAVAVTAAVRLASHGVSARDEPTAAECRAAGMMRRLATPPAARKLANPIPASEPALAEARTHFADHCALCHGNDGRGDTTIGRNLFPKAPDMRLPRTQQLTDGELFYVITNGIRLTGMPAWGTGTAADDDASWKLVLLIRRLGELTPEQIEQMKGMNPVSRVQIEQDAEDRRWLEGGGDEHVQASGEVPAR